MSALVAWWDGDHTHDILISEKFNTWKNAVYYVGVKKTISDCMFCDEMRHSKDPLENIYLHRFRNYE